MALASASQASRSDLSCAAKIGKQDASAVDRQSEDAVALAFMQALAHKDTDFANQFVETRLEEEHAQWINKFIQLFENIGGIHSITPEKKTLTT
ncbi:MAG: hypothetical protein ACK5ME_01810 [Parahaliea sp.]